MGAPLAIAGRLAAAVRRGALAVMLALTGCSSSPEAPAPLRVETHRASETSAHVNAHLVLGEREALLVDATMTVDDARAVADRIDRSGRRLHTVFVTNSQPDKYLGLAPLLERHPDARVVTTRAVAEEIAERGPGYLERLRRRHGERIADRLVVPEPLDADALLLEGRCIEIHRFQGGECPNAAALYVPELRTLLSGAIVFEGSHLFLRERDIPGWRAHLDWIEGHGGIERILPGHGAATDLRVLDAMRRYMDDFEAAVALGDRDAAVEAMRARYPDYALERLLREYSVPAYLPAE